jgi:hypothetical protein
VRLLSPRFHHLSEVLFPSVRRYILVAKIAMTVEAIISETGPIEPIAKVCTLGD